MSDFANVAGYRLRYRIRGSGPLAVFGHGLMGSIEQVANEADLMGSVEEKVRLLLYDARGHGESEGPSEPHGYSWESLGSEMGAWLEHTGEDAAVFGGASMGAASALWLAVERPAAVRALVLLMPPPLGLSSDRTADENRSIQSLELLATAVQTFGVELAADMARQFPGWATTQEEAEERTGWLRRQNGPMLASALRGLTSAAGHHPDAYRSIRVPTLILGHEGDSLHPVRAVRLLADAIPQAVVRIADAPGYWQQHPQDFVSETRRFLESVG